MKKKIGLLVVFICLLTSLMAFDGNREGFLLGFGGGISNTNFSQEVEWMGDSIESDDESEVGFATDFKIGYAPTNNLELYYSNKVAWFSIHNALDEDVTIANGLSMLGASYFIAPELKNGSWHSSLFFSAGIGMASWSTPFEDDGDPWEGTGYSVGIGYEFNKHYRISLDFITSETSLEDTFTTNSNIFMFTFSGLAF